MISNNVDINSVLLQMRELKARSQGLELDPQNRIDNPVQVNKAAQTPSFGDMFSQAINGVNNVQQESNRLATALEMGDPSVGITDVMIASQKASVSFEAMTQVRNKLVKAYEDVMNMPV